MIFMMKESRSKRRKSKLLKRRNQDGEDRISSLPDSMLCHILSFLPTKYAVATSILSKRWKLVWTSLPNLSFDDKLCLEYELTQCLTNNMYTRFENFVNKVLVLSHLVNINKFSLHCFKLRYSACLESWISAAIMRNVREIELDLKDQDRVELPESIYTCKTLEVLKLQSDFTIKIPPSGICFPCLKILSVVMYYPNNNLTERLFSSFPVLEDLSIEVYLDDDKEEEDDDDDDDYNYNNVLAINFNISSSTLKRLKIDLYTDEEHWYNEHKVVIRAPNLEQLYIKDFAFVSYMMHELHSLTKVYMDVFCTDQERILADRLLLLLKGITKAEFLSLRTGPVSALDVAYENFFPTFPNLTHLEVMVVEFGWRMLPIILNSLPNLETFVFEREVSFLDIEEDQECRWIESQSVPFCLLQNVKKIEIRGFDGKKNELVFVKYLLKNSEVLDKMIIRSMKTASKETLCQKLLMFPRGSKTCEVEFL